MGRLSTVIDAGVLVACVVVVGCDDTKPKVTVTNERSQAILGAPSAATPCRTAFIWAAVWPFAPSLAIQSKADAGRREDGVPAAGADRVQEIEPEGVKIAGGTRRSRDGGRWGRRSFSPSEAVFIQFPAMPLLRSLVVLLPAFAFAGLGG